MACIFRLRSGSGTLNVGISYTALVFDLTARTNDYLRRLSFLFGTV